MFRKHFRKNNLEVLLKRFKIIFAKIYGVEREICWVHKETPKKK